MKDEMADRKGRSNSIGEKYADDHEAQMEVISKYFKALNADIAAALSQTPMDETAKRLGPVLDSLWDRALKMSVELGVLLKDDTATDADEVCKRYSSLLAFVGDTMVKLTVNPLEQLLAKLACELDKEGE